MTLELKCIVTNLIRVSYCYIAITFTLNIPFKQLYTSCKMEPFSYKGGCSMRECHVLRSLKEKLV